MLMYLNVVELIWPISNPQSLCREHFGLGTESGNAQNLIMTVYGQNVQSVLYGFR